MFRSTNNTIKRQYNFDTTNPLQHYETTRTPPRTINHLIGRKLIDSSYSTDYSITEDINTSSTVFYTPHSNLGHQEVLKKNSCPQNPQISKYFQTYEYAKTPKLRDQSKVSQTQINSNKTTEELEDCFRSPGNPYHQLYSNGTITDSATPVSKLSSSTISKKSPLTDDYSSTTTTKTTERNSTTSRNESSEALCKSSWPKSKTCHSFKVTPFFEKSQPNYSFSYVREDNFMPTHHINNTTLEKKAIFELSVNEDDLRILEEGIPCHDNQSSWLNTIPPHQQFSNKNESQKETTTTKPISQSPFFAFPQRDEGNFIKSQIEIDRVSIHKNKNTEEPGTVKDSSQVVSETSVQIAEDDSSHTNRLEKTHNDQCEPSHHNDTAQCCLSKNSTFEINLDGSRNCTSSSQQTLKSCMEETYAKFQPEKKQANNTLGGEVSSISVQHHHSSITSASAAPIEHNHLIVDYDCTFLPSPILPKECSIQSNNTTFPIIDHSLLLEEEIKSLEKQALVKPDISNDIEESDKMIKAISMRNELNHYPSQLQFVRMPVGGKNIKSNKEQPLKFHKKAATTPKKNIVKQESRQVSELACSFKSNIDGFFMDHQMNNSISEVMLPDNMDIDDCEEFEKNKQRFKNKFIKRRAKLFLQNDHVNIITARSLSENLKILTEKACFLQRLKLQLEEKTLSIQSVCDRIVHEDLSWQLEDIIAESTTFWSTCDQVSVPTPSSVLQFLNRVCESENEIINAVEDLIDFVITSAKRMCKRHSLNINIILDTIRESAAIELSSSRSYPQLKSAKVMSNHPRTSKSSISPISSSTSEYNLYSSKTSKNANNFDPYHTATSDRLDEVFDIKKRNELFEIIGNNVDTVLDISSAIRHYASDDKMETLDTVFEDKFSAYGKILDEMKSYSNIDLPPIHSGSDAKSLSFY